MTTNKVNNEQELKSLVTNQSELMLQHRYVRIKPKLNTDGSYVSTNKSHVECTQAFEVTRRTEVEKKTKCEYVPMYEENRGLV